MGTFCLFWVLRILLPCCRIPPHSVQRCSHFVWFFSFFALWPTLEWLWWLLLATAASFYGQHNASAVNFYWTHFFPFFFLWCFHFWLSCEKLKQFWLNHNFYIASIKSVDFVFFLWPVFGSCWKLNLAVVFPSFFSQLER